MKSQPGRNDPCPCGSGKKYKHCCLEKQANVIPSQTVPNKGDKYKQYRELADKFKPKKGPGKG